LARASLRHTVAGQSNGRLLKIEGAILQAENIDLVWPEEGLTRVPYRVFSDPNIYAAEQQRIFRGPTWHYLGLRCQLPEPGDYVTTLVGEIPIILAHAADGTINAMVNRCAHRGALVCHQTEGNTRVFTCPYHNWSFDQRGSLIGLAFRNGVHGQGGMPEDFDPAEHGLDVLRVAEIAGTLFGTFSDAAPPLEEYLGPTHCHHIKRLFNRPMRVLGSYSQYLRSNWKLYMENVRDPYHASILHLFFGSFGLSRHTMEGAALLDERGWHHVVYTKRATDDIRGSEYETGNLLQMKSDMSLSDPSLLAEWQEFDDGITNLVQTVFPSVTFQQISNCLGVRHLVPHGVDESELRWTLLGFADDEEWQTDIRTKQANLIGPAGLISLEDGAVTNMIQRGIQGQNGTETAVVEMGGDSVASGANRVTEATIRGFWKGYRETMGL
jgi:phenylpropionate dioxygenase-like ring-hydroxylating dioxygenase large terminal subunit